MSAGYNGLGRRVRRTLGGVTIRYLYDGDDLAAEVDGSGNRIRSYAYWPGIDHPHSMRTWEGGQNGATYYYSLDLPGSTVQGMFDVTGAITHRYRYTPFGEPLPSSSSAIVNPLRFAARELDDATGLYYVRARWYDPSRGRFMSEDPIGIAGGINNYAYAANDPVNLSDPTGLCTQPDWGGWGTPVVVVSQFGGCGNDFRNWSYDGNTNSDGAWADAMGLLGDWLTGSGKTWRTYEDGSAQVADMIDAPGVNGARDLLCSKYSAGDENPSVTDYGARFGLTGAYRAGTNATRQFLGSYNVNIFSNGNGTATFHISNVTSMESAAYHLAPVSYERFAWNPQLSRFGLSASIPGGNMYQTIKWTQSLSDMCN